MIRISSLEMQNEDLHKDNQILSEKIHDYQEIIIDKKIDFGAVQ